MARTPKRPVKKATPPEPPSILEDKPRQLRFTFEGTPIDTTRAKVAGVSNIPAGKLRLGQYVRVVHECTVRDVSFKRNKDGDVIREHVLAIDSTKIEEQD